MLKLHSSLGVPALTALVAVGLAGASCGGSDTAGSATGSSEQTSGTNAGGGTSGSNTGGNGGGSSTTGAGGQGGEACVPAAEICDGLDNSCDGQVDEGCDCVTGTTQSCYSGDPGERNVGECKPGMQTCDDQGVWGACVGEVLPAAEACDALDNDCNGQVDDGLGTQMCGVGACLTTVPACENGSVPPCTPGMPKTEVCDGTDNDCNGQSDEALPDQICGVGACTVIVPGCMMGMVPTCTPGMPSTEVCDLVDNNCDGLVDETDPNLGAPCDSGQLGVCQAGTQACQNGGLVCVANSSPSPEQCDGLDNSCDGAVDDGNPGGGLACSTGVPGICDAGSTDCIGGAITCTQTQQPLPESCNGIDDSCNGAIDEGNPGGGQACSTGLPGICAAGTTSCTNGAIACNQSQQSGSETCNGLDDDCDGVVDDGNPGGGAACGCGFLGTISCTNGALSCAVPGGQPAVYFQEIFANNLKGWTLNTQWAIGPTAVSAGHNYGGPDPALDHTPTADNGVGGVVLGGNASTALTNGYRYLTSPAINTSAIAGNVFLEYWRWLNSDYSPYMLNQVQVFNSNTSTWTTVYQTAGSPGVQDAAWVKQSFNVTAHKSPAMQIRFGYNVGSSGVFTVSSWNVDDVLLTSAACP